MKMKRIKGQEKYWDKAASKKKKKTFTHPLNLSEFNKYVHKKEKILDYGCGYGRTLNELHNAGFTSLVGCDFSKKMVLRAKKEFPHLNISKSEDATIQFKDNSFDAIILFAVLTCIPKDEDQNKLMKEVKRTLKPNGIIYISDYLINKDERNTKRYNEFKDKFGTYGIFELSDGAITRHYSKKRVSELTKDFKKLWYKEFKVTTMNGNKSNAYQFIGKLK